MLVLQCFEDIPDPRTGNATRHDLLEVLTIALVASICGADSCTGMADFARLREPLFRKFLKLEHGTPSHDTFSRIFSMLEPDSFARCFGQFIEELKRNGSDVVSIDAKTLRRSFDKAAGRSPLAAISVFSASCGLVLGHTSFRPGDGDSEITAARELLSCLDLTGLLVTGDAIYSGAGLAGEIIERGGDYLLALKGNRKGLFEEAEAFFADPACCAGLPSHQTSDADHGRLEIRRHLVCHDLAWLHDDSHRALSRPALPPGLASLAMVEAEVTRDGKTTISRRYYLCSSKIEAGDFARAVRDHWKIENSLHWILDDTYAEDRARNRAGNGAENLNILRKLGLNILKSSHKDMSIARKRKCCGWSDQFTISLLSQMR